MPRPTRTKSSQPGPDRTPVETRVIKRITPPPKLPAIVATAIAKAQAAIKKRQLLAKVVLGGSLAKGTYLKGDHDVDLFVRFSTDYQDKELAEYLEKALTAAFKKVERVHGSRDYFHVHLQGFTFEFIPVIDITSWEEARNVTDMSPLHVDYVQRHVKEQPYLASDIRLTKQFCKAAKVYGAESYIGGFSGHVIDLLNIHYGSFRQLLSAAASWPAKVVIDPEHHYNNPMTELNDAKTLAPLVIVDPIQPDRNSSAALSEFAFKRFKAAAKVYLATKGSESKRQEAFFTVTPLKIADIKSEFPDADIAAIELVPLQGKRDVVGAKCYKIYQHCAQQLLERSFPLLGSKWEFGEKKTLLLFALKKGLLSADEELAGPPIHMTDDVARFRAAHKTTFTRDKRIYAVEKRKYRDAKKYLQALLKEKYITERVRSAKLVNSG